MASLPPRPLCRYDAACCYKAMKGIGTNETVLVETLTHRTNEEMAAINAAYLQVRRRAAPPARACRAAGGLPGCAWTVCCSRHTL